MTENELRQYARKTASMIKLPTDRLLIPVKIDGDYVIRYVDLEGWVLKNFWEEDYSGSCMKRYEWVYLLKKNGELSVFVTCYEIARIYGFDNQSKYNFYKFYNYDTYKNIEVPATFDTDSFSPLHSYSVYSLDYKTSFHRFDKDSCTYHCRNFLALQESEKIYSRGQGLKKALDNLNSGRRNPIEKSEIITDKLVFDNKDTISKELGRLRQKYYDEKVRIMNIIKDDELFKSYNKDLIDSKLDYPHVGLIVSIVLVGVMVASLFIKGLLISYPLICVIMMAAVFIYTYTHRLADFFFIIQGFYLICGSFVILWLQIGFSYPQARGDWAATRCFIAVCLVFLSMISGIIAGSIRRVGLMKRLKMINGILNGDCNTINDICNRLNKESAANKPVLNLSDITDTVKPKKQKEVNNKSSTNKDTVVAPLKQPLDVKSSTTVAVKAPKSVEASKEKCNSFVATITDGHTNIRKVIGLNYRVLLKLDNNVSVKAILKDAHYSGKSEYAFLVGITIVMENNSSVSVSVGQSFDIYYLDRDDLMARCKVGEIIKQ